MTIRRSGQITAKGKDKWLVRLFRGRDEHGRRVYHNRVIIGSKSDAQKYLTAKQREKDIGAFIETSRQTLNDHLDNWLHLIKPRVAEQTFFSYEAILRTHIRLRIGALRMTS